MAKATAKKAEFNPQQQELYFDPKRDLNPFWSSSLFSDVYLKNDLPNDYKELWNNDLEGGSFYKFYDGFIDLCLSTSAIPFSNLKEADTVIKWIVPVMRLLGWENNSKAFQNSYSDNTSFTTFEGNKKHVYRPDLVYFDKPEHVSYTLEKEGDNQAKLREARDKRTGSKIVVEAKYWDRLSSISIDKKRDQNVDDSASGLGPELQTLKYMELFGHDFGILTDGKTWKLFHKELSQGIERRCYEFDLGNLREVALKLGEGTNESKFRLYAKYFYYFFSKESLVKTDGDKKTPLVYEVFKYSEKYALNIESDLKSRFILTMGILCNSLNTEAKRTGKNIDNSLIRNIAESHLFNFLFVKSCEVRKVLPIGSIEYLKISVHEVIEALTEMRFDPSKNWDEFTKDFQFGETFGGRKFTYDGYDIFNRFINLYEIIHDGGNRAKDFGFEIEGFKESIFTKEEWKLAKVLKIKNRDMIDILFNLSFTKSNSLDRKYQQIPYSYFTARQLGSIYESFLDYKLETATEDLIYKDKKWQSANLSSSKVRELSLSRLEIVKKNTLYFAPDSSDRNDSGSFYTPDSVTTLMVERSLSKLIAGKTSSEILKLKICDPAMGSGHFLSACINFLTEEYRKRWAEEKNNDIEEDTSATARRILDSCIFGIDMNPRAVKLAKMSLWLLSAHKGQKLENLDDQLVCRNSLISKNDFDKHYKNEKVKWTPFDFNKDFSTLGNKKFDLVIGNPPWGAHLSGKTKGVLQDKFPFSISSTGDSFKYFVFLTGELIEPKGRFSWLIPASSVYQDEYGDLRRFILKNNDVKIIDLGDGVFKDVINTCAIIEAGFSSKKDHKSISLKKLKKLEQKEEVFFSLKNDLALQDLKVLDADKSARLLINDFGVDSNNSVSDYLSLKPEITIQDYIEDFTKGIETGCNDAFLIDKGSLGSSKYIKDVLRGADFDNNGIRKIVKQVICLNGLAEKDIPANIREYLLPFKKTLLARTKVRSGKLKWFELNSAKDADLFSKKRIILRQTGDSLIGCIVSNVCTINSVHNITLKKNALPHIEQIKAYLTSEDLNKLYKGLVQEEGKVFAEVKNVNVFKLPFPDFDNFDGGTGNLIEKCIKSWKKKKKAA